MNSYIINFAIIKYHRSLFHYFLIEVLKVLYKFPLSLLCFSNSLSFSAPHCAGRRWHGAQLWVSHREQQFIITASAAPQQGEAHQQDSNWPPSCQCKKLSLLPINLFCDTSCTKFFNRGVLKQRKYVSHSLHSLHNHSFEWKFSLCQLHGQLDQIVQPTSQCKILASEVSLHLFPPECLDCILQCFLCIPVLRGGI